MLGNGVEVASVGPGLPPVGPVLTPALSRPVRLWHETRDVAQPAEATEAYVIGSIWSSHRGWLGARSIYVPHDGRQVTRRAAARAGNERNAMATGDLFEQKTALPVVVCTVATRSGYCTRVK